MITFYFKIVILLKGEIMLLKFELSMPNVGSWNNKWTGEGRLYARVKSFVGKEKLQLAKELLDIGSFYYNFGDGWGASVNVTQILAPEAKKVRAKSKGFYGYDWMIDSIIENKKIISS
jgi:hypothetical protein